MSDVCPTCGETLGDTNHLREFPLYLRREFADAPLPYDLRNLTFADGCSECVGYGIAAIATYWLVSGRAAFYDTAEMLAQFEDHHLVRDP